MLKTASNNRQVATPSEQHVPLRQGTDDIPPSCEPIIRNEEMPEVLNRGGTMTMADLKSALSEITGAHPRRAVEEEEFRRVADSDNVSDVVHQVRNLGTGQSDGTRGCDDIPALVGGDLT